MKKVFVAAVTLLVFFLSVDWLHMLPPGQFPSWKDYSYYFKRTKYHGVYYAERDRGVYYFYDKKGRRCKL